LAVSVAAVMIAEACNIGLRPVASTASPALTRSRLSHVEQNYVRADTIKAAGELADERRSAVRDRVRFDRSWSVIALISDGTDLNRVP
jgi:predicted phosphoribosyltransferase